MKNSFHTILASLRKEKGLNQRKPAEDLGISQALLSHYENALREPGIDFILNACSYYGVSADYLLGLSASKNGGTMSSGSAYLEETELMTDSFSELCRAVSDCTDIIVAQTAAEFLALSLYRAARVLGFTGTADDGIFDTICEAKLKLAEAELRKHADGGLTDTAFCEKLTERVESELRKYLE